ncbi:phosphoadenosine phosphosulfate reductase [Citrobacter koseri]|uniref:Phosphoadenosine phosphosulfate reductase n=1 Tax=Citrobacter koseri TaxID=545 RepID=A0A2X2YXF6_CITKO|nr:phosphoadenosine phosphosulfate reductase [Citrobacter koseri]
MAWALENLPGEYVLSSSFGIQAAVSLHLVNQIRPDIPVILTDTGYLFPETYQFIDELTEKLNLNLKVYRATESAAWQEARYGKLWEQGVEGIEKYNDINKVEPMNRALKELNAQTWFAGLRREQSGSRGASACAGDSAWCFLKCCPSSTGITGRCTSICKNTV